MHNRMLRGLTCRRQKTLIDKITLIKIIGKYMLYVALWKQNNKILNDKAHIIIRI